jgi:hypothetical protein
MNERQGCPGQPLCVPRRAELQSGSPIRATGATGPGQRPSLMLLYRAEGVVDEDFTDYPSAQRASDVTISAATEKLIVQGKAAWESLKRVESWDQWRTIGFAIEAGRKDIMESLGINDPHSNTKKLKDEIGIWLKATGFNEIDKTVRSRLRSCIENLTQIEQWRKTLDANERVALNHPNSIWRKYTATLRDARAGKPHRADAKDEVIRELQDEVDRLTKTVAEMEAATPSAPVDNAATVEWERQGELTSALNTVEHETLRRTVAEERMRKAEAWELEPLLTPEERAAGKTPGEITADARERLLKVLAGALHPTATLGEVVTGIRGYHRVAFGYPLDWLHR